MSESSSGEAEVYAVDFEESAPVFELSTIKGSVIRYFKKA